MIFPISPSLAIICLVPRAEGAHHPTLGARTPIIVVVMRWLEQLTLRDSATRLDPGRTYPLKEFIIWTETIIRRTAS